MSYLTSVLFNIFAVLWTISCGIFLFPIALLPRKYHYLIPNIWCSGLLFSLKVLCGIRYRVEGLENLPTEPFIIASRHQSAYETILYSVIFKMPAFVLKKELLKLPFIGYYLKKVGMIAIDRKAGTKSLEQIIKQSRTRIDESRNIIIFPEGTRTKPDERKKLNRGVFALWKELKIPVIAASLNSGEVWPRNSFRKKSGEVVIKFHKIIPSNSPIDTDVFMQKISEGIFEG